MKRCLILQMAVFAFCFSSAQIMKSETSTEYNNPIIWADVPDVCLTRSGSDYYLISTTMHLMPGAPVMTSKDLVHWNTSGYVFDSLKDNSKYDLKLGTVYGRGQWASSIRYHKGKFYVLFSPNDQPFRSYIYQTDDPKKGRWKLIARPPHFHDASLFFDDDNRVFVYTGSKIIELNKDLSDVKIGGINKDIFERDPEENGLLEGNQVIKYKGKYYLLMISWPKDNPRRQVCYRADTITGPYEKKIILQDNFAGFSYAGQGGIIDDENHNWYALIFQDRGAVGRVPLLMPVNWIDGWPILGDENGKVPFKGRVPLKTERFSKPIVESDDFSQDNIRLNWQWNHNPVNNAWSLKERKGFLRLKTSRIVNNLYAAPNTLTQRMEGPKCTAIVSMDVSKMKEGDKAGMSAFNGNSAILCVSAQDKRKYLSMSKSIVELDNKSKEIIQVSSEEIEKVEVLNHLIYLRIDADFNIGRDLAEFYYSFDNKNWIPIGEQFKMIFDYKKLFMGTRFAVFNYCTINTGGYVDFDFFDYKRMTE